MLLTCNSDVSFKDLVKGIVIANLIVLFTYVINYDFGTYFNDPTDLFDGTKMGIYEYNYFKGYLLLNAIAFIGAIIGYTVSKIFFIGIKNNEVNKNYNKLKG